MNKLKIILLSGLLSGCITNINFDAAEYSRLIQIKLDTETYIKDCGTSKSKDEISKLTESIHFVKVYSGYRISRTLIALSISHIEEMVVELDKRTEKEIPSKAYCEVKLHNIAEGTENLIRTIGVM